MEINLDTEALKQDVMNRATENGIILKIYCPLVNIDDLMEQKPITPITNIEGHANTLTLAMAIMSMKSSIDELLKKHEGLKEAYELLNVVGHTNSVSLTDKKWREQDE